MSWNIYLGPSSLALKPTIEQNFDPKRWTESAEGTRQCKNQTGLRKIPSALWRQTVDDRLLTIKCSYCWCGDEWNHVNRYSERSKSIPFFHDRLCDPWFWPPLIYWGLSLSIRLGIPVSTKYYSIGSIPQHRGSNKSGMSRWCSFHSTSPWQYSGMLKSCLKFGNHRK